MTNQDIDQFINELKKDGTLIRQRGSKTLPTKELSYRNSRISHAPYITVEHGNSTDFYEFEKSFSSSKLSELIAVWILMSIRAKMLLGKFYLVVNEKDKSKFSKIIREKELDIEIITIT